MCLTVFADPISARNNIKGTIPTEIGQLTNLKHLDLSKCAVSKIVPCCVVWRRMGFSELNLTSLLPVNRTK